MNIKIKDCILECSFDLKAFKKDFRNSLVLEYAVKDNLVINFSDDIPKDKAKELIYLGFDWGGFFRQLVDIEQDKMTFKAYNIELEGYNQYEPLSISNPKEFELKERELKEAVMITQDGIPNPNFCLNNLFYMTIFHFGHKKYKVGIDMR